MGFADKLLTLVSNRIPRDAAYVFGGGLFLATVHYARPSTIPFFPPDTSATKLIAWTAMAWVLGLTFSAIAQWLGFVPKALPWEWEYAPRVGGLPGRIYRVLALLFHGISSEEIDVWVEMTPPVRDPVGRTDFLMHVASAVCTASGASLAAWALIWFHYQKTSASLFWAAVGANRFWIAVALLAIFLWMWRYDWIKHVGLIKESFRLKIRTLRRLRNGRVQLPQTWGIAVSGGIRPYTWNTIAGTYPEGVDPIDGATGVIAGIPTKAATTTLTIRVTDAVGNTCYKDFDLTIKPASPSPEALLLKNLPAGSVLVVTSP